MYDAADRRFMAVDSVKGTVAEPQTLAQYTYVLDKPINRIDPSGLDSVIFYMPGARKHAEVRADFYTEYYGAVTYIY